MYANIAAHLLLGLHLLLQPGLLSDGLLLSNGGGCSSCCLRFGLLLQLSNDATSETFQVTVVQLPLHKCRTFSVVSQMSRTRWHLVCAGVRMCRNQRWLKA